MYFNYGMYWLFNLLVKGGARDGLILIRALEPRLGVETMKERRQRDRLHDLCSGPGKLALALGIEGSHHGLPMAGRGRPARCGLRMGAPAASGEVVADVNNDGTFYAVADATAGVYQMKKLVLTTACTAAAWVNHGQATALASRPKPVVIRGVAGLVYADASGNLKLAVP